MLTKDFSFSLPDELIARYPVENRSDSRLLVLNKETGGLSHHQFYNLADYLCCGDVLVLNNTRVIPARMYGTKETGGKIEVLIDRIIDEHQAWAHIRASKAPKMGSIIKIEPNHANIDDASDESITVRVLEKNDELGTYRVEFLHDNAILELLDKMGEMPLPPYMGREVKAFDTERYQTVYAEKQGSVAAPTAGLHFNESLLEMLRVKGIKIVYLTLHVGAGTFQPVRVDNVAEHKMHSEYMELDQTACDTINNAKANGHRVFAVGTTCIRSLETAASEGTLSPYTGETDIFITPGFKFQVVDGIVTNFHLPESTLIMLVCAFAGKEKVLAAYQKAVEEKYRFYSYGDAMLIGNL